jgi:hypothetical protein
MRRRWVASGEECERGSGLAQEETVNDQPESAEKQQWGKVLLHGGVDREGNLHAAVAARKVLNDSRQGHVEQPAPKLPILPENQASRSGRKIVKGFAATRALGCIQQRIPAAVRALF